MNVKNQKTLRYVIIIFCVIILFAALPVSAEDTTLIIDPSDQTISTSETFTVNVYCNPSEAIKGFELEISFDSSLVKAVSVTEGDIFNGFTTFFNSGDIDNSEGLITSIYGLIVGPGNTTSPGTFCKITFSSKSLGGMSPLMFSRVGEWTGIVNEEGYISINAVNGEVTIEKPESPPPQPPSQPPSSPPPPIEEGNHPPETPDKPSGPTFIELGVEYTYETSAFDLDGDEIRFRFDWGDGNFSEWSKFVSSDSPISFSYVWNSASNFSIRAIAQDENGLNSSWSEVLDVTVSEIDSGEEPVLSIKFEHDRDINESIIFDASESFDPDGSIVSYSWDFGDGNSSNTKISAHKYENPGKYVVTLTVTDNNGYNYSTSKSLFIFGVGTYASEKVDEEGFPIYLIYLLIGIFIIENILIVIFFGEKIKGLLSYYYIKFYSKIFKWYTNVKIQKLDYKIKIINERLKGVDAPRPIAAYEMKPSVDNCIQSPSYEDAVSNADLYNNHIADKSPDQQVSDFFMDKSNEPKKEQNIHESVDRLFPLNSWEKDSDSSDKSLERTVDNHLICKRIDKKF